MVVKKIKQVLRLLKEHRITRKELWEFLSKLKEKCDALTDFASLEWES